MKQGWEIKKLGDICCKKQQIARAVKTYSPSDSIVYIDISAIDSSTNEITEPTTMLLKDAPSRAQQVVEKNDILVSLVRPNLKNIALICDDRNNLVASSGFCILRTKENPRFLKYIVIGEPFTNYLISRTSGANYPAVREDDVKGYSIPIPPLPEQEKIVAELDCLSGIIEKKKQQLKEYDALAQSIFYEMFGNPIDNEKGWEVKKLESIGKIITGNTPSTKDESNYSSSDYCFVKPSDISKENVSYIDSTEYYISNKAYQNSRKLTKGSVLTTCIGIIGKVGILGRDAICNQQINAIILNEDCVSQYIAYALFLIRNVLAEIANAPIVPIINKKEFSAVKIPLPPLSEQQEFASKIEAIEKQKELIKQSIAETETLFNSRMDYYFS
ncbi:MAG: restriction endonuclease subunit S [Bacteroidales bacterium]|nr:restriction endonuclease subunit S [Bacteroidales bacterium]